MIAAGTGARAKRAHRQESIAMVFVIGAAAFMVLAMGLVLLYLLVEGTKTFTVDKASIWTFLTSTNFSAETKQPGAAVFILGSLEITAFAILVGGPLALCVGIFLSELAPPAMAAILKPCVEVLVGIPSVVYGWLGLTLFVPLIRAWTGSTGFGVFAAGVVLSIMILPTVISLSEDALRAVPGSLREGSFALGSTRWETIWKVVLPAAKSGLTVALILGIARAIGETLAVQMVLGNATTLPGSIFSATAALPTEIVMDMGGAPPGSPLQHALFTMALVLLLIAMLLIVAVRFSLRKRT